MDKLTAQTLIQGSVELFSLPDIYFQISEMINDPRFMAHDMGLVISKDAALSARLLKIVNSSFYGFQAKIDTISRAITIVGIEDLKSLVLATSVIDKFNKIPAELVDMTEFWMRSIYCGMMAKLLAKKSSVLHYERLYVAGLLSDLGSLVLYNLLPEESLEVLLAADYDRLKIAGLEREMIGFTHADVSSELVKSWGLPESLHEAIGCYLNPELSHVHKLDAHLLYLASFLTDKCRQKDFTEDLYQNLTFETISLTRLDVEKIQDVMHQVDEEFSQVFDLMAPEKRFH